ncbi:MAG: (Fe-S)-binding protein [Chloroflexi bacterium]|nr:(Fe-S)-binding protein [Chloroflexota bacterium]
MAELDKRALHLQSVVQPIYECLRCAFCFDLSWLGLANLCPAYAWGAFESYGARGRIAIARALLEGELEYDESLIRRVFACTECRACAEHCFKYIDTVAIFAAMREDLAARGLIPPGLAAAADGLAETHNLYGKPHERRLSWLKDRSRVDRPAPVAFFVGCTPSYVRRTLARDTYAVLAASGLRFTVLSDEWCCGHPFLAAGQHERAAEVMGHNVETLKAMSVERVVFECPGCMRAFREDVPEVLGEPLPFEIVHVTEEIARQVEAGRLRFDVYQPGTVVTYHDPCTLGRGLGIYNAPRTIIEAMPGMRLAEMPRHERDAYCCGAGSFVRYDYADFTDRTGVERFKEAESTGAQIVLTACPACVTQFQYIRSQSETEIQAMDLISLVKRIARWR